MRNFIKLPGQSIACNKKRFSKKEAESILTRYAKIRDKKRRRREKRTYHCTGCNAWHLTSKDSYADIFGGDHLKTLSFPDRWFQRLLFDQHEPGMT